MTLALEIKEFRRSLNNVIKPAYVEWAVNVI